MDTTRTEPLIEQGECHGVLIAITIAPGTNLSHIIEDLAQTCARHGDILEYDCEHLGQIECYDEGVVKES